MADKLRVGDLNNSLSLAGGGSPNAHDAEQSISKTDHNQTSSILPITKQKDETMTTPLLSTSTAGYQGRKGSNDAYRRASDRRGSSIAIAHEALKIRESMAKESVARRVAKGKINKKQATAELKKAYTTVAHTLDLEQLAMEYDTNLEDGLTSEQVTKRLAEIGPNALTLSLKRNINIYIYILFNVHQIARYYPINIHTK